MGTETRPTAQVALAQRIREKAESGEPVSDILRTDERVIARITDGIYRQPASALRELLANAYDADATEVTIETDPPRFSQMVIRDNGFGMSVETLAHVVHHIGGSLKRTAGGGAHHVTDAQNPALSPGGRKLIGKIGIGLFSVAQLTPHFQVITKTRGESVRRIADIILAPDDAEQALAENAEAELKTGTVSIWTVPAADKDSQGTEIVLLGLRPQAKDLLRSRARWMALKAPEAGEQGWMPGAAVRPRYHIGEISPTSEETIEQSSELPWNAGDSPEAKFRALLSGVHSADSSVQNPKLDRVLDNYFQMLWTLSLAIPAQYAGGHPFDQTPAKGLEFFRLSNEAKGQAVELALAETQSARAELGLAAPATFEDDRFRVLIDGVRLMRPLQFGRAKDAFPEKPKDMIFFGHDAPDLSRIPAAFRGGPLKFEAYLYWTPRIVPKDHNGVLVRIKGASGTLFDSTFMNYQVAELSRLKQLSAEIFVHEGLEGALNIDRESFNYASVHFQYISRWLHAAIRQLMNRHKTVSGTLRTKRLEKRSEALGTALQRSAEEAWVAARGPDSDLPPEVGFEDDASTIVRQRERGVTVFARPAVFRAVLPKKLAKGDLEPRMKAIATVLEAYGVFESMPYETQEKLLAELAKIISAEATDG